MYLSVDDAACSLQSSAAAVTANLIRGEIYFVNGAEGLRMHKPSRLSFSRREHASKGANKLFTADRLLHENPSGESEGQLLLCVSRDHEEWYCPRRQREGRGAGADPREISC